MNKTEDKLFLLDAYALIYRAYYALIKNPRINSKGFNTSAVMGFVNTLEEVLHKERPTHIGIAFDPAGPTFRHRIFEQYKAQREETPEVIRLSVPIIKDIIRAYNIPILEAEGYEADDVIGTLATQAGKMGIDTYMLTPDKDYGQLVADHVFMYRPKYTGGYEVMGTEQIKEKFGIENTAQVIDMLGLMGDSADNIPGCPGVGEKTAQKLIAEFGSIDNLLQHSDQLKGALKKKIEENTEKIKLSYFLATIKTDVPLKLDMEQLQTAAPDIEALKQLFGELEFRTLYNKVMDRMASPPPQPTAPEDNTLFRGTLFEQAEPASTPVENAPVQGDLFAFFPPNGQEDSKETILSDFKSLPVDYQLIDTEEKRKEILQKLLSAKSVALDTETTHTEPMKAELVGMSFSDAENRAYYVPVPPDEAEAKKIVSEFKPLIENEEIEKVGQNIKYDIIVLSRYGAEVRGPLFDTMLAHYVLQPELRHNMDYLAEIYLHYRTIRIEELIGPKGKGQKNMRDVPPREVCPYACEDADVTLKLKHILQDELRQHQAEELFYQIEMPLVPVLAQMEINGVLINTEALKQTSELFTGRMKEIETEIYRLAGQNFNISSPKQVGEILFDRLHLLEKPKKTKTGQYITNEEILQSLKNKHAIVGKILDYRGLKKLLSTYVDALPQLINPKTGRIHTSFNQAVTATGRLSSSDPNLQNIPIRDEDGKEIRKAFIPDPGCEFFSADYSQIELRIMAHLSGDENMIDAFRQGHDIHAATSAKIYKTDIADVTKDMRRKAKTANFGIIYGISVFGLAERMGVDRKEARELIDGYFRTYPGVSRYIEESKHFAQAHGYVETVYKRKRYLPDINSRNATVKGYAERNAVNAPIQGSAADIIKVAMARIFRRFRSNNLKAKLLLQVHDELNFSVPKDEKAMVEKIVREEMEQAYIMKVPLQVEFGWGQNWLEAH